MLSSIKYFVRAIKFYMSKCSRCVAKVQNDLDVIQLEVRVHTESI
jgi:hypothetical protein